MRMEVTEEERRAILGLRHEARAFNAGVEEAAAWVEVFTNHPETSPHELAEHIRKLKRQIPGMTKSK